MKAESLDHVVTLGGEAKHDDSKPQATRQYGIHFDSKVTVTTKRRHISILPRNVKYLWKKYAVLSNLWLLAQKPGHSECVYLDVSTFRTFLVNSWTQIF